MLCRHFMLRSSNPIAQKVFNPINSSVHIMVKHMLKIQQYLLQNFESVFDHFLNTWRYRVKIQLRPSKYCFSVPKGTRLFYFPFSVRVKFYKVTLTCYCECVGLIADFEFWLFPRVVVGQFEQNGFWFPLTYVTKKI